MKKIYLLASLFIILGCRAIRAEKFPSFYSLGPEGITAGGLYFGNDRAGNILLNPAATSNILRRNAATGFGFFDQDFQNTFLTYAHPTIRGVLTSRVNYLTDNSGAYRFSAVTGFGLPVFAGEKQNRSIGINMKVIGEKHDNDSNVMLAWDVGMIQRFKKEMSAGITVSNMAPSYMVGNERYRLPLTFRFQIDRDLNDISIAAAYEASIGNSPLLRLGTEFQIAETFSARAGYGIDISGENKISAGLKAEYKDLTVNYTTLLGVKGSASHLISAGLKFGEEIDLSAHKITEIERVYREGKEYYITGNLVEARRRFFKVSAMDSDYKNVQGYLSEINRGVAMLRQRRPLEGEVGEIDELLQRAGTLFETGQYNVARQYYAAILLVDENNEEAKSRITEIREITREKEERERSLAERRRIQAVTQRLEEYHQSGRQEHSRGNYEQAIDVYQQGRDYAQRQNMGDWVRKFNTTIGDSRRRLSEMHFARGHRHYQRNEFRQALEEFQTALEYDPHSDEAKDKIDELESRLEQADREKAEELYTRGLEEYRNENPSLAAEYWRRALELNPDHTEAKRALERIKDLVE